MFKSSKIENVTEENKLKKQLEEAKTLAIASAKILYQSLLKEKPSHDQRIVLNSNLEALQKNIGELNQALEALEKEKNPSFTLK